MIQAVIFDMDGLLIDSEPFWRLSHINALKEYGYTITEDDVRQIAGKRTDEAVRFWQERFGWEGLDNELIAASIVENVKQLVRRDGVALPGVYPLVELLAERDLPLAVASSSGPDIIEAVLAKLELTDHLRITHSAVHERAGKPAPDVFLATADKLGVEPARCVVFEDSLNGVRAARLAGMKCVAIPEQPYDRAAFKDADAVVDSLEAVDWPLLGSLG